MRVPAKTAKAALSLSMTALLLVPLPIFAATKPQYLPPIAPHVDSSAFQQEKPAVAPAPAPSSVADNYSDEPAQANDRTKDLLRQALQKHGQGDMSGAERLFKQVLSIDPSNSDANFNLGAMYEDRGDLAGALKYYQAAARVSPSDSDIRDALSSVQDKMRQQQVAQQTAQQMQQKQQLRDVASQAAAAYKAGNYDQAINQLQQVAKQDPSDANVQFGLAQAYRGKGDKAHARQYLNRALALSPDNQLYRATLNDLNHDSQKQDVAQQPPAAPDYRGGNRGGSRGGSYGGGGYGNNYGSNDDGTQGFDNSDIASSQGAGGGGDGVQPFTSQGQGQLYGHEVANGVRGMGMGGMGIGSALGLGGLGGLGGMMGGGAYYGGRGTRLVRNAVAGSLAGAAIGGLTNMHGYGGFKSGAIRGALTGGIMGLITGF